MTALQNVFFSISSRNYIGYVKVLHQSLMKAYGEIEFYLALADSDEGIVREEFPFKILSLGDLADNRVWAMAERYNITEFATSIKPYIFSILFEMHPGSSVFYFDPDMLIMSPLIEAHAALESGANAVLTPHLTEPSDHHWSKDESMLRYGVYNLGFVAMRANEECENIAAWWADRMEHHCLIDFNRGLFVDQKWCDLIPAFLPNTHVLRHPGYNIAYWNLLQRNVEHRDGEWLSNGLPLRFVHFSGIDILNPSIFSRHADMFHHSNIGDLRFLLEYYREQMLSAGLKRYGKYTYAFKYAGSGTINLHTAVSLSDKLKQNANLVDHSLEPISRNGRPLPSSVGAIEKSDLAVISYAQMINDPVGSKRAIARLAIRRTEAEKTDSSVYFGTCAMCRTTTPMIVEYNGREAHTVSSINAAQVSNVVCRCGFSSLERAAIHGLVTHFEFEPTAPTLVDDELGNLKAWIGLRWALQRGEGQARHAVSVIKERNADIKGKLKHFRPRIEDGGMLILAVRGNPLSLIDPESAQPTSQVRERSYKGSLSRAGITKEKRIDLAFEAVMARFREVTSALSDEGFDCQESYLLNSGTYGYLSGDLFFSASANHRRSMN